MTAAPRRAAWLGAAAVAAAVVLVFRGVAGNGLLRWDDDINVVNNPHVHALTWANLRWMFTDAQYMRRYLPLGWLRWALEYSAFGPGALSFHLGNLAFHAIDTVLLFFLLLRLLRLGPVPAGPGAAVAAAALGALAWAIHPLRAETVSWVSTGQYCQAAGFLLLSALAYLRAAEAPRGGWLLLGSVAAYAASLLSYPAALGYPGALLVLDYLVLGRARSRQGVRRLWLEKIPFFLVTAAVLAATVASRYQARGIWTPPPTLAEFGAGSRLMQAFYVWAYFLWKPLLPLRLSPVYTALVRFDPWSWPFLASAAAVIGITGLLLWRRREWPRTLAVWLCHLVLLVPMLGLTEHPHYTNDRYDYVASLPWSAAVAAVLVAFWSVPWRRWAALAVGAAALLWAGAASAAQVRVWRDSDTLFRYVLARLGPDPYRYDILIRLGRLQLGEGRPAEAEGSFRQALQVHPDSYEARGRLGLALLEEGRAAEAAQYLGAAARLDASAAPERAALIERLLRGGMAADAIDYAQALVRLNPALADAQADLGVALAEVGRTSEALPHLAEAARLQPNSPDARTNFALVLRRAGREEEARAQLEAALRIDPSFLPARRALGR